jgi:hypothetical protein
MFGIGMGLFGLVMGDVGVLGAVLIAAFAGTLFAVLWVASMQRTMRRLLRRIYDADAKIVGVEPTESEFPFRLPCSLLRSPTMAVGGVLHLGPSEWRFVPHQRNLPRHRELVSISPLENLELVIAEGRLTWLSRLFIARAPDLLELRWNSQMAQLVVPNPESTAAKLRNLLSRAA